MRGQKEWSDVMAVREGRGRQTAAERYSAWVQKMPQIGPVGQIAVTIPWLLIAGAKSVFGRIYVAAPAKWRAAAKAEAAKQETDEGAKVKQQSKVSGLKRNALLYNLFTLVLTAVLLWFLAGPTIGAVRGTFRWLGGAPPQTEMTFFQVKEWLGANPGQLDILAQEAGYSKEPPQQAWPYMLLEQGTQPTADQFITVNGADGQTYRLALLKDAEGFVGVLIEGAAAPQPVQNGQVVTNASGLPIGIVTFNPTGQDNGTYAAGEATFIGILP